MCRRLRLHKPSARGIAMARLLQTTSEQRAAPAAGATFLPSDSLRDHVQGYLYRDLFVAEEIVRPVSADANPMLVLSLADRHEAFEYSTGTVRQLPEAMLVGSQSRRPADLRIVGHHQVLIVCFQPAALTLLFGLPGSVLADTAADAAVCIGPEVTELVEQMRRIFAVTGEPRDLVQCVERFLEARLIESGQAEPIHRAAMALHRSNGSTELGHLVRESGHSVRHFNRAFLKQFGMTPKRFARVVRFGYAMRLKLDRPLLTWAAVSQQAGYYDQNHMAKEFKTLVGEGPSSFLKSISVAPPPLRAFPYMSNSY